MMGIVVTRFTKIGGPLTKEISISNGALKSDGSKCVMGRGRAQRVRLDNLTQLGELMTGVTSNQALGLGRLRDDLPDCVRIMTKTAAAKLNGSLPPNTITRTAEAIDYTPGEAAVALIDFDQKGMPADVRARVASAGGCEGVLTTIVPGLATCGRVVRTSTSAGIYRTDTGATMPGSGGLHILPLVQDGGMSSDSFGRCTSDAGLLVADGTSSVQPASCSSRLVRSSIVTRRVSRLTIIVTTTRLSLLSRDSVSRMTLASPNSVGTDTLQCEPVRDTFVDDPTQPLGQRDAGIAGGQWRQARQPLRDLAGARQ